VYEREQRGILERGTHFRHIGLLDLVSGGLWFRQAVAQRRNELEQGAEDHEHADDAVVEAWLGQWVHAVGESVPEPVNALFTKPALCLITFCAGDHILHCRQFGCPSSM